MLLKYAFSFLLTAWIVLILVCRLAKAQDELTVPSETIVNSSTTLTLPSLGSQDTYKLSLSLCTAQGEDIEDTILLYASNDSSITDPGSDSGLSSDFLGNSAGGLVQLELYASEGAWIGIDLPSGWTASFGVAIDHYVHDYISRPLFSIEDADNDTAVFFSPTYFPTSQGEIPSYQPALFPQESFSTLDERMIRSPCFVGTQLNQIQTINTTATNLGVLRLKKSQGGTGNETWSDGERFQYVASNLTQGTNYTLIGIEERESGSHRVFNTQYFNTKQDTNCRLLFDLDFCPDVTYSVPAPPSMPNNILVDIFRDTVLHNIEQFNTSLSTFPCGAGETGDYSFVQSCDTCLEAYRTWVCAVVMPRCDSVADAEESNTTLLANGGNFDQGLNFATTGLQKRQDDMFLSEPSPLSLAFKVRDDPQSSRTPIFSSDSLANMSSTNETLAQLNLTTPFPYAEILPCSHLCYQVAAACPPLMNWQCPTQITIQDSYADFANIGSDEVQGGDDAGPQSLGGLRSRDRFGHVYCNALNSDRIFAIHGGSLSMFTPPSKIIVLFISFVLYFVP